MFRQYRSLKRQHPDALLLFRMGDFYEMFYEDAERASRLLDLTLTVRGRGTSHAAPMCGFPHHQLESYAARLVRAGLRVAVCEQVEDPRTAKGLVRREIVRIVTPGTVTDLSELDGKSPSWLASVAYVEGRTGAAFLEATTGEFLAWECASGLDPWEALADRLQSFGPREIVFPEGLPWTESFRREQTAGAVLTPCEESPFSPGMATAHLCRHFGVASLDGFGLGGRPAAVGAAGGLLVYAQETQKSLLRHVDGLALHEPSAHLLLDPATRRNLEIERSLRDGGRAGSLLGAVDRTETAPGARLLRSWLLAPLLDVEEIAARQDAIQELVERAGTRRALRERLSGIQDIERLVGRAATGTAHARDLLALRASLEKLPSVREALAELEAPLAGRCLEQLDPCADVAERLGAALLDHPPQNLREGGLIREGFDPELDRFRAIRRDGSALLASLESREREATGIASLKVRYNKVFGYYIEVSRPNLDRVPDRYRRKQTVANGERFVTPELEQTEAQILEAQSRMEELEYELFLRLRDEVAGAAPRLKATARAVALADVLSSLAELASERGYTRPRVHTGRSIRISGGRHPVVELSPAASPFQPNDTDLDPPHRTIAILTGPNMGGKSTYLRQVALIAILAQAGSFVPAEEAEIGIADRVFCRVGSSDNLAEGQSTFLVEMSETAHILRHATARSLVLLDEVGRGTSTFDGLAIAWAVVEHLQGRGEACPRTIFATHYHELTELAVALSGVVNLRMGVREWGDRVVFLHRVEPGAADRSYGIHVAKLAGIPKDVVERAKEILSNLERDEFGRDGLPRRARPPKARGSPPAGALPLFLPPAAEARSDPEEERAAAVLAELRSKDPNRLTPLEALELVFRWQRSLRGARGGEDPGPSGGAGR